MANGEGKRGKERKRWGSTAISWKTERFLRESKDRTKQTSGQKKELGVKKKGVNEGQGKKLHGTRSM